MKNRASPMWLVVLALYASGATAEPEAFGNRQAQVTEDASPAGFSWAVDTTPPETKIIGCPPPETHPQTVELTVTGAGSGGRYWCRGDSSPPGPFEDCGAAGSGGSGDTIKATFIGLNGIHTFEVYAEDAAGNVDPTPALCVWTSDVTPPKTTIVGSPRNPTNQTTAQFEFSANEGGVSYACSVDTMDVFHPCASPVVLTNLGEVPKPHTFRVYATDAVGNSEGADGAAVYSWTVDLTPPSPPIVVQPPEGECTNSNSMSVEGSAEAGAMVTVFLGSPPSTERTTTADGSGRWSVDIPLGELSDGTYTITANAKDLAGNTSDLSDGRSFRRDTDPPETWVAAGRKGNRVVLLLSSDESGVRYKCNLYDGNGVFECPSVVDPLGPIDGSHVLAAWAVDCAGNVDPTPAIYQWVDDTVAPEVIVSSPKEDEAVGGSSPAISGTSEQSATVQVLVDDTDPQTPAVEGAVTVGTDGHWSLTVPVSLSDGDYTVTATATDLAGNVGPSFGPRPFKVDTTPPETEIISGPQAIDVHDSAGFIFQSSEGGTLFEYSLDKVPEQESDWIRGTIKYQTPSLKNGKHFLLVRAMDDAGNKDPEPARHDWEVAAERPRPPEFIEPVEGAVVYSLTPTIMGTTVPEGTVELFIDLPEIAQETPPSAVVLADADGNWAFTFSSELPEGAHTLVGRATDRSRNKEGLSSRITFTVAAPTPAPPEEAQGLGCDASSSSASPWLALLGLLAVTADRARRQRSP